MSMDGTIREVERAVGALRRSADDASAWSDEQRSRFDSQRLQPLIEAGTQLAAALRRAEDHFVAVHKALQR